MIDGLTAAGPHPSLAAELSLFGQFVGRWELDRREFDRDGTLTSTHRGEWHFGWVLDGRAIQDVWICPARGEPAPSGDWPGEWGTVIRFYDPAITAWRVTWHGPRTGAVVPFTARRIGEEIVLSDESGGMRWIFSDIEPDRFRWRSELADGEHWWMNIEMRVWRVQTAVGPVPENRD